MEPFSNENAPVMTPASEFRIGFFRPNRDPSSAASFEREEGEEVFERFFTTTVDDVVFNLSLPSFPAKIYKAVKLSTDSLTTEDAAKVVIDEAKQALLAYFGQCHAVIESFNNSSKQKMIQKKISGMTNPTEEQKQSIRESANRLYATKPMSEIEAEINAMVWPSAASFTEPMSLRKVGAIENPFYVRSLSGPEAGYTYPVVKYWGSGGGNIFADVRNTMVAATPGGGAVPPGTTGGDPGSLAGGASGGTGSEEDLDNLPTGTTLLVARSSNLLPEQTLYVPRVGIKIQSEDKLSDDLVIAVSPLEGELQPVIVRDLKNGNESGPLFYYKGQSDG